MEDKNNVYVDSEGNVYHEGDIAFNPFFGDYWLVEKYSEKEQVDYDTSCPLCLSLYGDKDVYNMDIDEPSGFKIIKRIGDTDYDELLAEMREVAKKMNTYE